MPVVISDSSPLVHLSAIGRFDLLRDLYAELIIPPAVWNEVTVAGKGRPGAADLTRAVAESWITIVTPNPNTPTPRELQELDPGEAEALLLAIEKKAEIVLIDELRGRSVARALGVRAVGTLGVLVQAKQSGYIQALRTEIEKLRGSSDLQFTPELEALVLKLADET